jgi:hypothetical protein
MRAVLLVRWISRIPLRRKEAMVEGKEVTREEEIGVGGEDVVGRRFVRIIEK